jgi:hypothetical protein
MKTQVYSWRLKSERKAALEEIARKRNRAVSELLDEAVDQWLSEQSDVENEEALQQRLRQAAAPAIGSIAGGDPERAEQSRARLRVLLAARRNKRG